MISGSRDSLPLNLQGLWVRQQQPGLDADYHTDINVQMNYWLADRAGLSRCFDAFADYCVAQLPSLDRHHPESVQRQAQPFPQPSGKIAGWTVAFSTNLYGGSGWWWHPAGNAWLCNTLWQHYEYTQDTRVPDEDLPAAQGRLQFWEARLIHDRDRPGRQPARC